MPHRFVPFPPRPAVAGPSTTPANDATASTVYEIVTPAALRGLLEDLADCIYAQSHLPIDARHRWFARVAAAASVNALLDDDATAGPV